MEYGVFYFPTHYGIEIGELAEELESRNFSQLLACEHTHIPISRKTPFPPGGELPERYKHTLDPFVALSFAASRTTKLKIGTGICLLPQRDVITTAKAAASLDRLSNGRFIFGVGAGWNQDEMENHGVVYKTRFKEMSEKIEAIKSLWVEEESEYHGTFVDFDPVWSSPKPLSQKHPPIIIGGETDYTLKRIANLADGWLPRGGKDFDPSAERIRLDDAAKAAGRNPEELTMTVFFAPTEYDELQKYKDANVSGVLFDVPDQPRDKILPLLDKYAKLMG